MPPMIDIVPGEATPVLRALQRREGHAFRRAFTVLDGTGAGRILTDDPAAPTWAAVHERSDSGTLFLTGALHRELVADLIGALRREHVVSVGLRPDDPLLLLLPADWDHDDGEVEFEDRSPDVDVALWMVPPAGLRLARIDQDLLHRCAWGPWMCGSMETALDHGLGYCLLDGEAVVAEAFAGPGVDGVLELGTITHVVYRRRGLGAAVCARTILECERRGLRTWWNTSLGNAASAGLARKLGYQSERHYRVLGWSRDQ
jgi:hypothetical protein